MLHREYGYSFSGDAPITSLTERELAALKLDYLLQQEDKREQAGAGKTGRVGTGRRKYTQPSQSTVEAQRQFEKN